MGEDYYPMPWTSLKYDNNLGGYRVAADRNRDRSVYEYYRAPL
jgi:hypothetical protein